LFVLGGFDGNVVFVLGCLLWCVVGEGFGFGDGDDLCVDLFLEIGWVWVIVFVMLDLVFCCC